MSDKPREIIDISHPLSPSIAVWPGDSSLQFQRNMSLDAGDPVNLGSVTMSLHTGTHADAPAHYLPEGATMADCQLSTYIGEAVVIDATDRSFVEERHLGHLKKDSVERLLFKTNSSDPESFEEDYNYFSAEAARAIVRLGVKLVGIDTPSVDRYTSEALEAHHVFGEAGILILENLRLVDVTPGAYELIALPLKFVGMDGSPIRAILRPL